jgi:hypothetical protein
MEVYDDLQNVTDNISLADMDYLFHGQLQRARTPITTSFFSIDNLQYLSDMIAQETGKRLNRTNIIILPNNQYFLYLAELADGTANREDIYNTICLMDKQVIDHEVPIHYNSLRRRELFFKWFIFNDRTRVMDRPMLTNGRHRFDPIDTGVYSVGNPARKNFNAYQNYQSNKTVTIKPLLFEKYYK